MVLFICPLFLSMLSGWLVAHLSCLIVPSLARECAQCGDLSIHGFALVGSIAIIKEQQ